MGLAAARQQPTVVTKPQTKPLQEGYTGLAALIGEAALLGEAATDCSSLAFVRQMVMKRNLVTLTLNQTELASTTTLNSLATHIR